MTLTKERVEEWYAGRGRKDRTITINGEKGLAEFDALVAAYRTREAAIAECEAWRKVEHLRKDEPHAEFMTLANARAATDAARREEGQ